MRDWPVIEALSYSSITWRTRGEKSLSLMEPSYIRVEITMEKMSNKNDFTPRAAETTYFVLTNWDQVGWHNVFGKETIYSQI